MGNDIQHTSDLSIEERERLVIERTVALAHYLRDERDRLANRLAEVERELNGLALKLSPRKPAPASDKTPDNALAL